MTVNPSKKSVKSEPAPPALGRKFTSPENAGGEAPYPDYPTRQTSVEIKSSFIFRSDKKSPVDKINFHSFLSVSFFFSRILRERKRAICYVLMSKKTPPPPVRKNFYIERKKGREGERKGGGRGEKI